MKYVGLAHRQLQQDAGGRELMCVYIRQGERGTGSTSIPFGPYPMQRWHVADAYELLDMTAVPRHREVCERERMVRRARAVGGTGGATREGGGREGGGGKERQCIHCLAGYPLPGMSS